VQFADHPNVNAAVLADALWQLALCGKAQDVNVLRGSHACPYLSRLRF